MKDIILKTITESGHNTAVIDGVDCHSYSELGRDIERFHLSVASLRGTHVIVSARRCYTSIALYAYCTIHGLTIVPVASNIDEKSLNRLLDELKVSFFYTDSAESQSIQVARDHGTAVVLGELGSQLSDSILFASHRTAIDNLTQEVETVVGDNANLYLIFTSGTTGNPKGVSVHNSNLMAYLESTKTAFGFGESDIFSHISPLTFDFSIHEIFLAFYNRAAVAVLRENDKFNISRFIEKSKITVWSSVPSTVSYLSRSKQLSSNRFPTLRTAFVGGEPVGVALLEKLQNSAPGCAIYSYYGPTECTVALMACPFLAGTHKEKFMPLGIPFGDHKMLIRDEQSGVLQEFGCGDAYLAGPQVLAGYWNNQKQSNECFSLHSEYGQLFKTGDIVSRESGGVYKFIARDDDDVKISGYRFDTAACRDFVLEVSRSENVVVFPAAKPGEEVFSELFVVSLNSGISERQIARIFRDQYDNYLQPRFFNVTEYPMNANGKVDKKELLKKVRDHARA